MSKPIRPSDLQLKEAVESDLTWEQISRKFHYKDSKPLRKRAAKLGYGKRKILKPSKQDLEYMIVTLGLTPYEIADKLGYADAGWSNVYKYCREYGIQVNNKLNEELRRIDFTPEQRSIVFGTLLGDGSLRNTYKNFALVLAHGEKQLDYLNWKKNKLSNFIIMDEPSVSAPKSKYNHAPVYSWNTISHPFLTKLRRELYPNDKKTVTLEWLNQIDELALAVWYLDDGSQNKRYGTISFATNCFSYEEHMVMQEWFWERWNIETKIEAHFSKSSGKLQNRLRINTSYAKDFVNIISPSVPECMIYKVSFNYR